MKIPTAYHDRIVIENGGITRYFQAEYDDKKGKLYTVDVYKETDDGEYYKRNIYNLAYGYGAKVVAFPGLPLYAHGPKSELAEEEEWKELSKMGDFGGDKLTESDIETVCILYSDFRYVLNKYPIKTKYQLMEVLTVWKLHPGLEYILSAGYLKVGMNPSFWKLSEKKQKEICQFMRKYKKYNELKLREIQSCLKFKDPGLYAEYLSEVPKMSRTKSKYDSEREKAQLITFEDFIYLKKQKNIKKDNYSSLMKRKLSLFSDVLAMLIRSNHDVFDPYWRHPNNLILIYDRLLTEEKNAKMDEVNKLYMSKIKRIEKKFENLQQFDKYSFIVSSDYMVWKKQSETLHQCFLRAAYYIGMSKGEYVLIFIQQNGIPVATAQVYNDGHVGQFYADEYDRNNCHPSEDVKTAFYKWLETVPKSKFRMKKHAA